MTTHLRGRTIQAGAFLALVVGLVAGAQTAALADPPSVQIQSLSSTEVSSGSTVTMRYTVSNPGNGNDDGQNGNFTIIRVSGIDCTRGDCSPAGQIQNSENFEATLTAPNVAPGQSRSVTVTVTATANNETGQASQTITVKGPETPQNVRQVSGRVRDNDGERLSGVQIAMQDSAGHSYDTTTDNDGGYSFTSSDANPIAPGTITVAAVKEGYQAKRVNVQGGAGRSVNVPVTLKKIAAASPSPTPSVSASATAEPTELPADEETTEEEPSAPVGNAEQQSTSAESEGSNWLLIIMGALLVAAGIGAFVLVWLRRKNADNDDSSLDGPTPGFGGPGAAPAGGSPFDATRVAAPLGAPRGGDATMVAPAGGMPAGIGDAPTMVHRPVVEDEFPDPYGAPIPPAGGFAGGSQWDDPGGYGDDQQPYGPQSTGYGGSPAGGYGDEPAPQRYDEHTSLYQPEQPQPQQPQRYDEHTSLYQPEQGNGYGGAQRPPYGQPSGYGQPGYDEGGWSGQGDGYGPQQSGYDQPQYGGGYDQPAGYGDQGGYGGAGTYGNGYGDDQQPGGYEQPRGGSHGAAGYEPQPPGGYDDQDGYYGGQQGQPRPRREWD